MHADLHATQLELERGRNPLDSRKSAADGDGTLPGDGDLGIGEPLPAGAGCVLVIDDDPVQRELMQRFLTPEGFHVCVASGGEAGLRLARQLHPVAITLDVMMPEMDGWSVLRALKADDALRDIPVVMLTMVDDPERGVTLGASDYATKPVDRRRLSQLLRKYTCSDGPCPVLVVDDDSAARAVTRTMGPSKFKGDHASARNPSFQEPLHEIDEVGSPRSVSESLV